MSTWNDKGVELDSSFICYNEKEKPFYVKNYIQDKRNYLEVKLHEEKYHNNHNLHDAAD